MKILGFLFSSTLILLILAACGGSSSSCACGYYEACRNSKCECINGYSDLWGSCVQYTRPYDQYNSEIMRYVFVVDNPPSGYNLEQTIFSLVSPTPDNLRQYIQNGNVYYYYLSNPTVYKYNYYEYSDDRGKPTILNVASPAFGLDSANQIVFYFNYISYHNAPNTNEKFFKDYNLAATDNLMATVTGTSGDDLRSLKLKYVVSKDINGDAIADEVIDTFEVRYVQR